LTLDTCVPSFRCSAAHLMHKKMPIFQLAHPKGSVSHAHRVFDVDCDSPGFFASQSAHLSLPFTLRMSSCRTRSLRACCLLVAMAKKMCRDVGLAWIAEVVLVQRLLYSKWPLVPSWALEMRFSSAVHERRVWQREGETRHGARTGGDPSTTRCKKLRCQRSKDVDAWFSPRRGTWR
jgi:hypothetical protein